jgi:hypothetical protein
LIEEEPTTIDFILAHKSALEKHMMAEMKKQAEAAKREAAKNPKTRLPTSRKR